METKTLMFESIDKLAQKTGQKDLCEAVKKLYKACFESAEDDDTDYAAVAEKAETTKLFEHPEGSKSFMLDKLEETLDNLGCAIIETKDHSVDDNLPGVYVDYVYSDDAETSDSIEGSVGIGCGFDGKLDYYVRDEYGTNLKDYVCAARGAPLGYSKRYARSEVEALFADIATDVKKVTGQ